jgi:hypothetical protein
MNPYSLLAQTSRYFKFGFILGSTVFLNMIDSTESIYYGTSVQMSLNIFTSLSWEEMLVFWIQVEKKNPYNGPKTGFEITKNSDTGHKCLHSKQSQCEANVSKLTEDNSFSLLPFVIDVKEKLKEK